MTDLAAPLADQQLAFRDALIDAGWLLPSRTAEVPGLGPDYVKVFDGVGAYISTIAAQNVPAEELTSVHFPPLFSTRMLEKTEYVASFPQLLGTINSFHGGDREYREMIATFDEHGDWQSFLAPTRLALTSAACHSLYGHLEGSTVGGKVYELTGTCFRHEPSIDPMRMVSFRMREYVVLGTPEEAKAHRENWLVIAKDIFESLGLDIVVDAANDPFFGRSGAVLASGQLEAQAKFELLAPVYQGSRSAIGSANYHDTHFGSAFNLSLADGRTAHSSCSAFGLDRIVLALAAQHGMDLGTWPASTRALLGLGATG